MLNRKIQKSKRFDADADVVFLLGDSLKTLKKIPDNSIQLIITSPPYNLQKEYETKQSLDEYLESIKPILTELKRVLNNEGSICWQVGNFVSKGEVFPLDIFYYEIFKNLGFKLRNRIIWHFNHGLHGTKRLSGRYEVILWFTKSDIYTFNLDDIRIKQKYPGKRHSKGKKKGKPSGNILGKNPSDYWGKFQEDWDEKIWDIPNVKSKHPEKTLHPCQFPISLVERCVLAFTDAGDFVLDPFSGVGTSMLASLMHGRRSVGCELQKDYMNEAKKRVKLFEKDKLPYRDLAKSIYVPKGEKVSLVPAEWSQSDAGNG